MHVIGVGTVIVADDGSEAIETLKNVGQDPLKGGINSIDII
jgi:3-keto-L-gulonate-6-phosphate decarboxylase